ncbi:MAG: hypothetical protein LCH61_12805 [Proteobacteria bacterium]|nr:hypothetical protein [Pseudomonadota bacterium]
MSVMRPSLHHLLGGMPRSAFVVRSRAPLAFTVGGLQGQRLDLERGDGVAVRGFITGPPGAWSGLPAVLYCHAHGGRYEVGADELLVGRPALQPEPYAHALARQGVVALAIDLCCFGERAGESENLVAKRHLWQGTTLFGDMLADLSGAFDLLAGWPGVDEGRIGAFGISMGATLAFWLAALEPRLRSLAHLCCFADLGTLVRQNGHDRHGLYLTVPGLLAHWRTGEIAGCAAPRGQFAAMGACDPLTPPAAIALALQDVRAAYAAAGAGERFEVLIDPATGHVETLEMRHRTLRFFEATL